MLTLGPEIVDGVKLIETASPVIVDGRDLFPKIFAHIEVKSTAVLFLLCFASEIPRPRCHRMGVPMLHKTHFPLLFVSQTVVIGGLLAGISWGAQTPRDNGPVKITETEIAVTAATDDIAEMATNEANSSDYLKQLAGAIVSCAEKNNGDIPRDTSDNNGTKLLSWRVHILPYIEEEDLYKQFKLDEPWDSENNLKLVEKMPKILASPRVSVKRKGFTVYQGFAGPGSFFEPGKQLVYPSSIPDGLANTIMIVESSAAVPWTKPVDMPFDPDKDLPDFGKAYGARPLAALCDASVRIIDTKKVGAKTLKAAITTGGEEFLGADWRAQ